MSTAPVPFLATRLLLNLIPGARGQALAGDLTEQFGHGRSVAWYWRQVLAAILISNATDRTLGGLSVLAYFSVVLLLFGSVARHPASLGLNLLNIDLVLLFGYGVFANWAWRQQSSQVRSALALGAQAGLLLGLFFITGHLLESLLPPEYKTAQLARGAGTVLAMLSIFGATGSATRRQTHSAALSALSGLWAASVSLALLLGFVLIFNLGFESQAETALAGPFVDSKMTDPGAFLVRNALQAASEFLVRLPIVAVICSVVGSLFNIWIMRWPMRVVLSAAWLAPVVLVSAATLLWYANSLDRIARPPFILAGVFGAGLALCAAHPICSCLWNRGPAERHPRSYT